MTELQRPPFNLEAEKFRVKREEAIKQQRAWSVIAELYGETGTSGEFAPLIEAYNSAHYNWLSGYDSETGRRPDRITDIQLEQAKAPLLLAFGESGMQNVLDVWSQSLPIRRANHQRSQES